MLLSDVCLSACLSRTSSLRIERPRRTKIGTEVAHVTRDGGILRRPPAQLVKTYIWVKCTFMPSAVTLLVGRQECHLACKKTEWCHVCWWLWFAWNLSRLKSSSCHHCHLHNLFLQQHPGWSDTLELVVLETGC